MHIKLLIHPCRGHDLLGQFKATIHNIILNKIRIHGLGKGYNISTWLRKLLSELGFPQPNQTTIYHDNQSKIALSENPRTIPEASMWKLSTTLLGRKCLTNKYN